MQGVGFRPHVWRLATALGLSGWVSNAPEGVTVEIQGPPQAVKTFVEELRRRPPRLARIAGLEVQEIPILAAPGSFVILPSLDEGRRTTLVSPDIATCEACRREVTDPADRRYGYPFTNCTDCGPRYSIIAGLPYDRSMTSMRAFPMCPACQAEYDDPRDRRFHAQPNACPVCGPRVWLETRDGRAVPEAGPDRWPAVFRRLIKEGAIIAVKGLGGFHLACDAHSEEVVARLRARKRRPSKPFAVMAKDIATARRYVSIGPAAEELLLSPAAPIVICPLRSAAGEPGVGSPGSTGETDAADGGPGATAPSLAPGSPSLGIMLAYTPLHLLLFDEEVDLLVMTSGNRSEHPIVRDNDTARTELAGIVDYFLFHDREIVNRCEDSVVRVTPRLSAADGASAPAAPAADRAADLVIPFRRSRGYAPAPIDVQASLPGALPAAEPVLAAGGEMKSVFGFLRGGEVFLSPHLGEMGLVANLQAYRETYRRFTVLLDTRPTVAAVDAHPGYLVSRLARRLAEEEATCSSASVVSVAAARGSTSARVLPVYHHHAHLVSCLADNGRAGDREVLGVVADGTGYGPDGAVWGGEILAATAASFRRVGHLAYTWLPGGDVAARRPYRSAAMHLHRALGPDGVLRLARLRPELEAELRTCLDLLEGARQSRVPAPAVAATSSLGRLFDAVAALADLCRENTYEGEAAVLLGELALPALSTGSAGGRPDGSGTDAPLEPPPARYRFRLQESDPLVIDPGPFLGSVLEDLEDGRGPAATPAGLAALFHAALALALADAVTEARRRTGLNTVVLTGGTFQNPRLVELLSAELGRRGFEVLTHRQVPPNDGGLALGQAVVAAWMLLGAY